MSDFKKVNIKITKDDSMFKFFYLENIHDNNPDNDKITEIHFDKDDSSYIASIELKKFVVHVFNFMAMGREGGEFTVEIPEISFKKVYMFSGDRQATDTLSLPIY